MCMVVAPATHGSKAKAHSMAGAVLVHAKLRQAISPRCATHFLAETPCALVNSKHFTGPTHLKRHRNGMGTSRRSRRSAAYASWIASGGLQAAPKVRSARSDDLRHDGPQQPPPRSRLPRRGTRSSAAWATCSRRRCRRCRAHSAPAARSAACSAAPRQLASCRCSSAAPAVGRCRSCGSAGLPVPPARSSPRPPRRAVLRRSRPRRAESSRRRSRA